MTLVAKSSLVRSWYEYDKGDLAAMANKKVSLYRKCKTPEGWKRYPASMSANGKVKPNTVMVSGVEAAFPVGHYELR
jgi:hypothetical protein